ncbi:MAG: hypothetical protein AAGI52_12870 [Bacteroidota bacterium]
MPRAIPVLFLAMTSLAVLVGGCSRPSSGLPPGTTVEDLPEGESWDAELRISTEGRPSLTLAAPYMARFDRADTNYVYLGPPPGTPDSVQARIAVRLFGDDGQPTASIAARQAWYYEKDGRLVADGRVVAETFGDESTRIEAARLRYTEDGQFSASGNADVDLRGQPSARIQAQTVSGAISGGRYTASGDVSVDAGSGRTLRASRVTWDGSRFRAPGAFQFIGPGERIRGVGLVATGDLSRYSFSRVRGEIEVQE